MDTHTDSGRAGLGQGWASPGIPRATQPSHISTGYREGFLWKRGRDNGQFMSRKFVLTEREGALKYFNRIDVSVAAMPPWDPRELTASRGQWTHPPMLARVTLSPGAQGEWVPGPVVRPESGPVPRPRSQRPP